jgi:hypothetical protein
MHVAVSVQSPPFALFDDVVHPDVGIDFYFYVR